MAVAVTRWTSSSLGARSPGLRSCGVDDKVGKDTRDARESSPQPERKEGDRS